VATRLDPLSYGVDGLRSTLIGVSHFGLGLDAAVLVVSTILLLLLGRHLFSKIQV
jgi:ABC-2 type transport system permease protein